MDKQLEALRLADDIGALTKKFSEGWHEGIKIDATDIMDLGQAAEELRRLHQVNQELVEALRDMVLIFTPAAKDSTAANLIEKATSLIAKHKEQA